MASASATASDGNAVSTLTGDDVSVTVSGEQREGSADTVKMKLKTLNNIVLCIAFLEWAGNAIGTLAFLWATVILLGGFSSLLNRKDFWYSTIMIFVEGSRVFIRNDASMNQWLFGSTSAFRWENLSSPQVIARSKAGRTIAIITGVGLGLTPIEFRPEIVAGILKVAILVIFSQLLTRQTQSRWRGGFANTVLFLLLVASYIGGTVGSFKTVLRYTKRSKANHRFVSYLKISAILTAWELGTMLASFLALAIMVCMPSCLRKTIPLLCFKVIIASGLACLPFLQGAVAYYRYVSISIAVVLQTISYYHELWEEETSEQANNNSFCGLLLEIIETILPILFFWSVMFPLPGISLKLSFYLLFSVIKAVLVANLQIPIAFVQVLLSILRLRSLLGHHHRDYNPLPPDASPNLVPSIVIFFMLELCQGSSYILATILGFISLFRRRLLVIRDLGFEEKWGEKAINLYFRQAYQARTEKGLFHSGKEKHTPNLKSFAIQSLGYTTSHEMQIVGLRILHNYMQRGDSESKKKLITEIVKDAKNIITNIIGLISYLTEEENCGDDKQQEEKTEHNKEVVRLSLEFVGRLAINGGKISARFRQELSENPFFLDSLESILNLEDCQQKLWEPVMNIIEMLALDEVARQEVGRAQSIIPKIVHAFLMPDDRSLRMSAGKALANLTIMSTDNCLAILLYDPGHDLIKNLINMLEDEYYTCVAANLLHNICANSRDKLMNDDFGANVHLKSALPKVMEIIMTKEGKELEAALCVASQIGYVIHEDFAQNLESYTDADAEKLVEKLVNTLKDEEPCPEHPRIRRVLIEVVISIVGQCPRYIKFFVEKKAKEALDKVKGTPSRWEKYRVFLSGEGVVAESLPMRNLVDKAKRLIDPAISTPGAQPIGHA